MDDKQRLEVITLAESPRLYSQSEYLKAILRTQLDTLAALTALLTLAGPPPAKATKAATKATKAKPAPVKATPAPAPAKAAPVKAKAATAPTEAPTPAPVKRTRKRTSKPKR